MVDDEDDNTTRLLKQDLVLTNRHLMCKTYDQSFLQFGLTSKNCNDYEKPLCLICNKLLTTESMKPSKLKRHFESKYNLCANKPQKYFERLLKALNN